MPDQVLNSAIGNQYGDIYEDYLNSARASKLNRGVDSQGRLIKKTGFFPILTQGPLAKL